jgi:hypothetical protein
MVLYLQSGGDNRQTASMAKPTCVTGFNMTASQIAFREAFPVMDNSIVKSISPCTITNVFEHAIETNFGIKKEIDVRMADDGLIQRIIMFAALGLLANDDSGGEPWATIMYNPSTEAIESVPGSTATRQLFADVIVVLTVLALGRVWLHTRIVVTKVLPGNEGSPVKKGLVVRN